MRRQALVAYGLLALSAQVAAQVRPTDFDHVEGCKSLGEITGKTAVCSLGRARANAMKEATRLGATHIVWTNARCVLFAGHRAQGEMFDCRENISKKTARPREPADNALGIHATTIPEEHRRSLGRNTGAFVVAVDDESPAFFANVLAGDIVVAADGEPISVPRDLARVDRGAKLVVIRDGVETRIETPR